MVADTNVNGNKDEIQVLAVQDALRLMSGLLYHHSYAIDNSTGIADRFAHCPSRCAPLCLSAFRAPLSNGTRNPTWPCNTIGAEGRKPSC